MGKNIMKFSETTKEATNIIEMLEARGITVDEMMRVSTVLSSLIMAQKQAEISAAACSTILETMRQTIKKKADVDASQVPRVRQGLN